MVVPSSTMATPAVRAAPAPSVIIATKLWGCCASQHFTALHSETVFWQKPRRFLARHQKPSSRIEPERWLARMPVPRSTSGMMLLHSAESELFEDASTGDAHTFVIELARILGRSDGQQTGGQWALDVVDEDDSAAGGIAVFGDDNLC